MIDVELGGRGLVIAGRPLPGRMLSLLLAALLEVRGEGGATPQRLCSRAELRDRIGGLAELHRTQLWRALRSLAGTPLQGLVGHVAASAGPYWLDEALAARCAFHIAGQPASPSALAALLRPPRIGGEATSAPVTLPPLAYIDALAQADHLLDRGELYPARQQLARALSQLSADDVADRAAIAVRRARISRRLADWAALQDDLRELSALATSPRLVPQQRRLIEARIQLLSAWHIYGGLGNAAAALARLDEVEPASLAVDLALRNDYLNLRGMVLRELALRQRAAPQAAAAVACFGEAIRCAALAAAPEQLQVTAANLANTLGRLHEAGLFGGAAADQPADGGPVREAVRWLLLSDAICARWQIATRSLLNVVFLLRLTAVNRLPYAELAALAVEQGMPLAAAGYSEFAEQAWQGRRAVHSQIPVDQRCAFFLVWATHAAREQRRVECAELCRRIAHEVRKLRDAALRHSYAQELAQLRAELVSLPALQRA